MKHYTPIDRDDAEQIDAMNAFFANNPNAEKDLMEASRPYPHTSATSVLARIAKDKKITLSIRSNAESIRKIKEFAKKQGIPYQTFLNAYIDEIAENLPN